MEYNADICKRIVDENYKWCLKHHLQFTRRRSNTGPCQIVNETAYKWLHDGVLHKTDGPAYVSNKICIYVVNGAVHRIDGPAMIRSSGIANWYFMNTFVSKSQKEFDTWIEREVRSL